jgi:trehalose synthase-fused probable maltokinase
MSQLTIADRSIGSLLEAGIRSSLEGEILPAFLQRQRWFSSKDAKSGSVRIERTIPIETDPRSLLLIVEADTAAETATYQFPVTLRWDRPADMDSVVAEVASGSDGGWLIDAYSDDVFIRRLLELPTARKQATQVVFRPSARSGGRGLGEAAISRTGAEQSNTSILIGPAILKAYRRLAGGVHPEQEVGAYLTWAGFEGVPSLLGTIELRNDTGEPVTLGILQRRIEDASDGWKYMIDQLGRLSSANFGPQAELQRFAERLGACTAGLHLALSVDTGDADFTPVPISSGWCEQWAKKITASAVAVFERLGKKAPDSDGLPEVPSLAKVKAFIVAHAITTPTFSAIRVHGDYHLGQVLVTESEIFIVDFEGEPMRPLAERRRKSVSLRDIAGMLRSFDYALACAKVPDDLLAAAAISQVKRAFLRSYVARATSCTGFPADIAQANKVLMLGLVEKALYEISYELNNRPDWVDIPVRGLNALIRTPQLYALDAECVGDVHAFHRAREAGSRQ